MVANDESVPEPLASRQCSGTGHDGLQRTAAESKVSLNRLTSDKLARC